MLVNTVHLNLKEALLKLPNNYFFIKLLLNKMQQPKNVPFVMMSESDVDESNLHI